MSEPKFKPESWHTAIEDSSYIKIIRIVNATGTLIANVFPSKFKPNIINANLIAAAPDMYALLQKQCAVCPGAINQEMTDMYDCRACDIGRVLRKARGEREDNNDEKLSNN